MGLLSQIQEDAVDSTKPIDDLLRRCKILARRLDHTPFESWVDAELNGYDSNEDLPDYRGPFPTIVLGNFVGIGWMRMSNSPIAEISVEEGDIDALFRASYRQGIVHYRSLLDSYDEPQVLHIPWAGNAIAKYATRLIENFTCTTAWQVVPRAAIEGMVDQVRNRVLTVVLEIERENPDADSELDQGNSPVSEEQIARIFNNTIITGHGNVVTAGSAGASVDVGINVATGDWEALRAALTGFGLPSEEIDRLERAVEADEALESDELGPGPAVRQWLGAVQVAVATGTLKLVGGISSEVVANLILGFIGAG